METIKSRENFKIMQTFWFQFRFSKMVYFRIIFNISKETWKMIDEVRNRSFNKDLPETLIHHGHEISGYFLVSKGRRGAMEWPARSPDLTILDIILFICSLKMNVFIIDN